MRITLTKGSSFTLMNTPSELAGMPGAGPNAYDPSGVPIPVPAVLPGELLLYIPAPVIGFGPAGWKVSNSYSFILKNNSPAGQTIRISGVPQFAGLPLSPSGFPLVVGETLIIENLSAVDAGNWYVLSDAAGGILERLVLIP